MPQSDSHRPASVWPPGPWLRWAWRGLFLRGHVVNQFFRFCLVGASGVVVNSLVMWGCNSGLGLHYVLASTIAYLTATVNNFTFNKLFTFEDKVRGALPVLGQYFRFLLVCGLGYAINQGVLIALVELAQVHPLPANLAGVLAATASNFIGNKFFAFGKKRARPTS